MIGPLNREGGVALWPTVGPMLVPALEREGWKLKPDQLLQQIADGLMGLYVVENEGEILAALVCEVAEYPNAMVFSVAYLGGHDLAQWAHLIGDLEREAVKFGCQIVRFPGRKGWGRVFPDYREVMRVYEREVMR